MFSIAFNINDRTQETVNRERERGKNHENKLSAVSTEKVEIKTKNLIC